MKKIFKATLVEIFETFFASKYGSWRQLFEPKPYLKYQKSGQKKTFTVSLQFKVYNLGGGGGLNITFGKGNEHQNVHL